MSATITTTRKLTVLSVSGDHVVNLPAQVSGIGITTEEALTRALEYITPGDIHAELLDHWRDAEAVDATPEQVIHHFVAWLAGWGEWDD